MTEECPSDNMTCVLTVLAEVQAAVDQLVGTSESWNDADNGPVERALLIVQMKLARFLQATLDTYALQHASPNADFTVRAARKLRQGLAP